MTIEIDHIGLSVSDFEAAKRFYVAALKPLRITVIMEFPASVTGDFPVAGLGADGKPFLWISGGGQTSPHTHLALRAESRAQVDAFHAAALAAGGVDNGPPGLRPLYHADYYGAFILDADGHNIEAVCHLPAKAAVPKKRAATRKAAPARKRSAAAKKPAARKRPAAGKAARRRKPAPRRRTTRR